MSIVSKTDFLMDDIEEQLGKTLRGKEIEEITRKYVKSLNKKVVETQGKRYSNKKIIDKRLSILDDEEKIEFFRQIMEHNEVINNSSLYSKIGKLISSHDNSSILLRNSTLDLLRKYPENIKLSYQKSFNFYDKLDYRSALDTIRLTIELLVKYITNSQKSLENQKDKLGKFFEKKEISKQGRTLFCKMLDMYEKIQNDQAKHNYPTKLCPEEVTLLMNQSTVIIKFLVSCNEKL